MPHFHVFVQMYCRRFNLDQRSAASWLGLVQYRRKLSINLSSSTNIRRRVFTTKASDASFPRFLGEVKKKKVSSFLNVYIYTLESMVARLLGFHIQMNLLQTTSSKRHCKS